MRSSAPLANETIELKVQDEYTKSGRSLNQLAG
jgi:hypothetical protein